MTTPSSSALYEKEDVALTLELEASKDGENEAMALLGGSAHSTRHAGDLSSTTCSSDASPPPRVVSTRPTAITTTSGKAKAKGHSNVSAVYRWYDVEEGFSRKKREESSIAKCKLCRQQGKIDSKTCVRFSKSVTSNLWRHLKENHQDVYEKHAGEKKSVHMHRVVGVEKRGRKKKVIALGEAKLDVPLEVAAAVDEQPSVPAKKVKRGETEASHLLPDYFTPSLSSIPHPHKVAPWVSSGRSTTGNVGTMLTGNFNQEKVREALGYLCLYEMLPFDFCSSHAFRNLMVECSGGTGGYIDDSNSLTMFAEEIASGYAKKLAAKVKVQTAMHMKMTDFAHLVMSEWTSYNRLQGERVDLPFMSSMGSLLPPGNGETVFFALYAVGLDQEFTAFQKCLHVSSLESYGHEKSIAAMLGGDDELKKAMERIAPYRGMPAILAVQPPCGEYQSFAVDHELCFLESVPTVLQYIVLATINGAHTSACYCLVSNVLEDLASCSSEGFRNRRLDKGEYIESSCAAHSSSGCFDGGPVVEITSRILEELPTSLTGHTYRDLMNKLMYLLAHFKQSATSRQVLRKLALEQCNMSAASYERLFIERLRVLAISMGQIYSVLSLVGDMMVVLKKYFFLHKDNDSDFSKLIQLSSLSRYEWSRVRYLTVILKPFAEAIAKLDGELYVVSSLIVPSVFTLIEKLRKPPSVNIGFASDFDTARKNTRDAMADLPEDIEAVRDLAFINLSACFGYLFSVPESSWDKEKLRTFNLLWSATILDPRTRSFIVKGSLRQQEFWEIVKAEAVNMAGSRPTNKDHGNEHSIALGENGVGQSTDLWDDLQANLASCAQEEMLLSSAKSSLEHTKSSNLLEVEVSFFQEEGRIPLRANPLEWWHNVRMKYPFLARLARYVLSIPCKVKVDDNPVLYDGGLVKRGLSHMNMADLCDLLAASMNLRTEKNAAASKQLWSTV